MSPKHVSIVVVKSGIYQITNTVTGKIYVGSAVDFGGRWRNHRWRLKRGDHHSPKLQAAWNKYGEPAFEFLVIERVPVDVLIEREQYWIDTLAPFYNIAPTAGSRLGMKHSADERAKMAIRSANISQETREKMAAAKRGRKASEETKRRMSLVRIGRKHTEESKRKLALASTGKQNALGFRHSDEAKARISALHKGRVLTPEHRKKLSESHLGQSPSNKGVKHSEETRQKLAEAWARRRMRGAATESAA